MAADRSRAPRRDIGPGRPLGASGLVPSALALGAAPLGNLYEPLEDEQAYATVRRGLECGLRYLDTAPHYGLGVSERRLGAVLRAVPRNSYLLSTKAGRLLRERTPGERPPDEGYVAGPPLKRVWDFSADGIRRSLEESLERLGLDRVDLLYLHDPDEFESQVVQTAYPALARLRAEGLVRAIGVGMNQSAMLARFAARLDLDAVLLAGRYTLLEQGALEDLLPACAQRGVAVVIGGALNSGLLADPRPGARYDYAAAPEALVGRAQAIAEVCARHEVPLLAAALQFPLGHPAVACVLVGARSPAEVSANADAFAVPIPDELWRELRESGLLAPEVPVPGRR
jgi:D-threo-aldose 1-dehydrogenase